MSTSTLGGLVNTIPDQQAGPRRRRRAHSDDFKADAVAACAQPGMSMAAVAMAHGINANLLRRWVHEAEMKPRSDVVRADFDDGAKAQEPKTVAGVRVLGERGLHLGRQRVHAAAHVGHAGG